MAFKFLPLLLAIASVSGSTVTAPRRGLLAPQKRDTSTPTCFAPATKLPPPKAADVKSAISSADAYLRALAQTDEVDSVVAAIVTPDGSIYEGTYGSLRANDSALVGLTVDRDSIYRIASVTKVFTAWESFILRDRGVLGLDDKVSKYIPSFKLDTTVRQLATHMSGIPGTLPAGNMSSWPHGFDGSGNPPDNGLPFPTEADTIAAINSATLMVAPYTFPLYSDTAYGVLGLVNAAADGKVNGQYAALIKRDIFDKLGMSSSSFKAPASTERVVVSSSEPVEAVRFTSSE
ncbi:beta-lactamase/transpeptidase-like protein [Exidia glandulosa HHB12029]|uniref:Beta-lactamase/transpeptidase-like protein n=1 Tax=Exidia glandulosa HHB12029 TaxID=1314781 RepID=A0A166A8G7_EXIGL|nr:beta-lactamase/transpeptidase-like protein [Exidia glandulosa HHB12029]